MEATTQHVEAVIEGIVSRVRCICGHRRRLPALQSGRESVVWGYRRAFGNISCPTARTGPECARLCRKNVELDGEAALPEAELRQALHAELERFVRGSWRRAKLEKKTDVISGLAREMDLSIELARTYDETARKQSGGRDAERLPQGKRSTNPPLFRISNHHTEDCGQPPAIDGDGTGKYVGYFANQYGEQSLFVYDYQTHEASVWMGETGWGKAHRVVDGRREGIILTESEATWIRACWLAAAKGD